MNNSGNMTRKNRKNNNSMVGGKMLTVGSYKVYIRLGAFCLRQSVFSQRP